MEEFSLPVLLAATTAYGAAVTKIVDALRKVDSKGTWNGAVWIIAGLAIGVSIALIFDVSAFPSPPWFPLGGKVLTGLAIGAAGSGWHEVFDALSGVAKATHLAGGNPPARIVKEATQRTAEIEKITAATNEAVAALEAQSQALIDAAAANQVATNIQREGQERR